MGWHYDHEETLREELIQKDEEIAELKAENQQLKDMLAAHNIHEYDPEAEDYKKMHPQEE